MTKLADLTHLQRQALLAAHASPTKTLVRRRDGFCPQGVAMAQEVAFTARLVRMMWRDFLLTLDDDQFPHAARLTLKGAALAQLLQIQIERRAQAGAA